MAERKGKTDKNGTTWWGPFDGADGRKRMRGRTKDGKDTSMSYARYQAGGASVGKGKEVDHKDNNRRNDSKSNLRVVTSRANKAKENRRRAGKK